MIVPDGAIPKKAFERRPVVVANIGVIEPMPGEIACL
jgi:hypothetical protein